jgi:mRNA interferase RelE/StbE
MQYNILLSKKAEKQLNRISKKEQLLVAKAIEELIKFSRRSSRNIKKMKTPFPGYRKRVGNYRILFEIVDSEKKIVIYKIGHRRDIYR